MFLHSLGHNRKSVTATRMSAFGGKAEVDFGRLEGRGRGAGYRPPNPRDHAIRFARTCYDHLAGTLGVRLTWSLVSRGYLKATESNFLLTKEGERAFNGLGIEVDLLRAGRRQLARRCLDWSEKRPHLGGSLGASLFASLCELGWLRPQKGSRVVSVTRQGRTALRDHFQIEL